MREAVSEPTSATTALDWGLGHVAHFYEFMCMRLLNASSSGSHHMDELLPGYKALTLFDAFRADAAGGPYPTVQEIGAYLSDARSRCLATLDDAPDNALLDPVRTYLHTYAVIHEHLHVEEFIQTRQTLGYPAPHRLASSLSSSATDAWGGAEPSPDPGSLPSSFASSGTTSGGGGGGGDGGPYPGYVLVPGGPLLLGAARTDKWAFDVERWAHRVNVLPFRIARACVTNAEFAEFVAAGGYERRELWSHEGWQWLQQLLESSGKARSAPRGWLRRNSNPLLTPSSSSSSPLDDLVCGHFDGPPELLRPHAPVCHVSWHEASAFCAFVGGRLPTEAEWEMAARTAPRRLDESGEEPPPRRTYPWGEDTPGPLRANLDGFRGGMVEVGDLERGDSAWGCRQMLGNVWEWTSTSLSPFPGFTMDYPYRESSCPWFGSRKVAKGGC